MFCWWSSEDERVQLRGAVVASCLFRVLSAFFILASFLLLGFFHLSTFIFIFFYPITTLGRARAFALWFFFFFLRHLNTYLTTTFIITADI